MKLCQNKFASFAEKKEKLLGPVPDSATTVALYALNAQNIVTDNVHDVRRKH